MVRLFLHPNLAHLVVPLSLLSQGWFAQACPHNNGYPESRQYRRSFTTVLKHLPCWQHLPLWEDFCVILVPLHWWLQIKVLSANKLVPFPSQFLPADGSDIPAKIPINNSKVKFLYFSLLNIILFLLFSPSGHQFSLHDTPVPLFVSSANLNSLLCWSD